MIGEYWQCQSLANVLSVKINARFLIASLLVVGRISRHVRFSSLRDFWSQINLPTSARVTMAKWISGSNVTSDAITSDAALVLPAPNKPVIIVKLIDMPPPQKLVKNAKVTAGTATSEEIAARCSKQVSHQVDQERHSPPPATSSRPPANPPSVPASARTPVSNVETCLACRGTGVWKDRSTCRSFAC